MRWWREGGEGRRREGQGSEEVEVESCVAFKVGFEVKGGVAVAQEEEQVAGGGSKEEGEEQIEGEEEVRRRGDGRTRNPTHFPFKLLIFYL